MSWLSSLFKKPKPNLTPDIPMPTQEQLFHTQQLRDFATDRISGKTAGFGPDYLDRTTNPAIASRESRFREFEMPQISSELSKRGLARSAGPSLATDVLTRATASKERDINELLAKFYQLNEIQKKADITEGLNLANIMQGQQADLKTNQASASERLANATAAQQNARNSENSQTLLRGLQGGAQLLSPALGGAFEAFGLGNFFKPTQQATTPSVSGLSTFGVSPIKSLTLDDMDSKGLQGMDVQKLLALLGGI